MKEQANLNYIKDLAGEDVEFQNRLMDIIKDEFPKEKAQFLTFYTSKKYQKSSEMIHKIKHKIYIFGLVKGYAVATDFEVQLKKKNLQLYPQVLEILEHIETYIKRL